MAKDIKTKEGFTIIEVVLVLAIAGLIFLMVFIALPALQRSQRDTSRRNDMSRVDTSLVQYQTNNSTRSNKPSGTASGSFFPNTFANGNYDLRGDCARIVLYTYVRWGETNLTSVIDSVDLLLSWIQADPVDSWELARNDSVESITGTRNVFVDYPQLAFTLFGQSVPSGLVTPAA